MLNIIQGGLFSTAYLDMKDEILSLTVKGERIFLIVPEQQAVMAESEFIEFLPKSAPLTFEVTNFTRLANTVYREHGGIAAEYLTAGKDALIMWMALKQLSPQLKMNEGSREISEGLVSRALAACSEMKGLALSPDDVAVAAQDPRLGNERRLREKLTDISKIMTVYTRLQGERYTSSTDDAAKLAEILEADGDIFAGVHFYITGFTSFTAPQLSVLSALMKRTSVTVHLTISKLTEDFFEFSEIKQTKADLILRANEASVEKTLKRREGTAQDSNLAISETVNLLWRNFGKIDNLSLQNIENSIRMFEASDPYSASAFIASDIKRAVMDGASYRDFAIIARDSERYSGIIDAYLEEAGIPCFTSKRTDISKYEAVKLIYAAFAAIRSGYSRGDVLTYAKCRLSGIDAEACDEFELYSEMWQIDREQFSPKEDWGMSPRGYDGSARDDNTETLARINRTRRALIAPLLSFSALLKAASTVREYATALVSFLGDISLEKRILEKCDELVSIGEEGAAKENSILWRIICTALNDMTEVIGDAEISTQDFENQLKIILSEANIGRLPTYRDVVTIGSANTARFSEKSHIYLFGVNAQEFPASGASSSYFTDSDKLALSSIGILKNENNISSAREFFFFSRAMALAKRSVTLLSFTRDEAYTPSEPAAVTDRISDITGGALKRVKISSLSPISRIYSPEEAIAFSDDPEVRRALIDAGYENKLQISEKEISNTKARLDESSRALMYSDVISLTQTKIDTYVNCPLSYFLGFDIGISEVERAEFDARNIGTFIHAILESFFVELTDSGLTVTDITAEEKSEMVRRAAEKYIAQKTVGNTLTKRVGVMIDRIHKAALPIVDGVCDELAGSSYIPRFFELRIKGDDDSLPSPVSFEDENGKAVQIRGIIDRVDVYQSGKDAYVRVIDYKTGKKTFSPSDIDEGRNLQMFLYLKAIADTDKEEFRKRLGVRDGGRIIPAGVIYIKPDMNDITLQKDDTDAEREAIFKAQKRSGMILDNAESIAAMHPSYIPVKYKKNGVPTAQTANNLYTEAGWKELNDKIERQVLEISKRMADGDISATAERNAKVCEYCKFKSICRKK